MKTRKTVIAVFTATLLVFALLVSSCIDQLGELSSDGNLSGVNYQVPAGKGLVIFEITDGNSARTIVPTAKIEDMYFQFEFTDMDDSSITKYPAGSGRVGYDATISVPLAEGEYSVLINAYAGASGDLIAGWNSGATAYEITSGNTKSISANLIGTLDSGEGTFNYDITVPAAPTAANTVIAYTAKTLKVNNGTTDVIDENLEIGINTNVGEFTLASGYYTVTVTLKANNCQDRVLKSAMHIYKGLPTNYGTSVKTIEVPAPVQNEFTVKFSSGVTPDSGVNGTLLTQVIANASLASNPYSSPASTTHDFDGWYTDKDVWNDVWSFTDKIYSDKNIYANWTLKSGAGITITFNITDDGDGVVEADAGNPASVSYDELLAGPKSLTFTAMAWGASAKWYLDGVLVETGDTFTIDDSNAASFVGSLATGTHVLSVFNAAETESGTITFEIENETP